MKYYHVIDHAGRGTIHFLIEPLCFKFQNHVLCNFEKTNRMAARNAFKRINSQNCVIILHTTGQIEDSLLKECETLFQDFKLFVFAHTSAEYQRVKDREEVLSFYHDLSNQGKMILLTPSKEVTQQYRHFGIETRTVQIGIPTIAVKSVNKHKNELADYYGKIVTTCGSEKDAYKYIKGIDRFEQLAGEMGLTDRCLVAGCTSQTGTNLPCKKFSEEDFLNVLSHATIYVQLSRYDTYNITAVQAKQLKVPTAVFACEGSISCMGDSVCYSLEEIKKRICVAMNNNFDIDEIDKNYTDSIQRESLISFAKSLERVCRYHEIS